MTMKYFFFLLSMRLPLKKKKKDLASYTQRLVTQLTLQCLSFSQLLPCSMKLVSSREKAEHQLAFFLCYLGN